MPRTLNSAKLKIKGSQNRIRYHGYHLRRDSSSRSMMYRQLPILKGKQTTKKKKSEEALVCFLIVDFFLRCAKWR
jgi:hypothetical protein